MKKDLAWQGVTFAEKKELLQNILQQAAGLETLGREKDAKLLILSTCIDVLNTARAAAPSADWKRLAKECTELARGIVRFMERRPAAAFAPGDVDVLAAGIVWCAGSDKKKLAKAAALVHAGMRAAKDKNSAMLLRGRLIKIAIAEKDAAQVIAGLKTLFPARTAGITPHTLTRSYQTAAQAFKFLAINAAEKAGLANQVLKAKAI